MTFPQTPRVILGELKVGDTDWANITSYIQQRDDVTITRGKTDETGSVAPSTCRLTVNNRLGYFSPRNPLSPLYGLIGLNTQLRVSIGKGKFGLMLAEVFGGGSTWCADSAATSIVGDIDIRVDMEILSDATKTWAVGTFDVASKLEANDAARSWFLDVTTGTPRFTWYPLGTVASQRSATATAALPAPATGRKAIRVTLDVNNGAGGVDVKFYYASDINGSWTQLGATVTTAGTSAILGGTAGTRIGGGAASPSMTSAIVYKAEIRDGIGGTLVASPDFAAQQLDGVPFESSTFADAQGNNWMMLGFPDAVRIWYGDTDIRFVGEICSLPPRWDVSGNDAYVQIEAAGILRRYGNGTAPATTGLRDWVLERPFAFLPSSYFPLSGAEGTSYSLNLGRVGQNSYRFYGADAPAFSYGKDLNASWLGSGMELTLTGNGRMVGDVRTGDDNIALDFVFQSPHLGRLEFNLYDYSGNQWRFRYNNDADDKTIKADLFAGDGSVTSFTASGAIAEFSDADIHTGRILITSDGSGQMQYDLYVDGTSREDGDTGIFTGNPWNGTAYYTIVYGRTGDQEVVNLAHLTGWSYPDENDIPDVADFHTAAMGYAGETAYERLERIALLGNVPLQIIGTSADTIVMGPQYNEGKLTQLQDAASADLGILTETRDTLGLLYVSRASMYSQDPVFTLDKSAGQVAPPFEPTDDDSRVRNSVTAVRRNGDSYRIEKTSGALSILDPPLGIGPYHDELTVNVQSDAQLAGVASWVLNLGTVDEARYPTIAVNLANPNVVAALLEDAVLAAEIGNKLRVTNAEMSGIYDDIEQLIIGYTEVLNAFRHDFAFNCVPASPYEVAVYADPDDPQATDARYDTNGSEVDVAFDTTATSFDVVSTGGTLWTTDPDAFPLDVIVAGERITVEDITGTTSPQTFGPVVRSVNGVVKAHLAGDDVRLFKPARYAL